MAGAQQSHAVAEACRLLSSHEPVEARDVARTMGLSSSYFQRWFKKHLGVTPQQYRRRVLAERGRDAIGEAGSVTEAVYDAGYSSSSRFYDGVGRELGMKPSVAHAGAAGERIEYVITECSLGRILVAWTCRGVCEVALADSAPELLVQLTTHFPKAVLEATEQNAWAKAVIDSVDIASRADIPLDIRGTAFQERVWQALRAIPVGETRTYSEIALELGQPSAVRAVARACASNPLAVVVPCHRVVHKNGRVSGYRWGADRKRELLRREAKPRSSKRDQT